MINRFLYLATFICLALVGFNSAEAAWCGYQQTTLNFNDENWQQRIDEIDTSIAQCKQTAGYPATLIAQLDAWGSDCTTAQQNGSSTQKDRCRLDYECLDNTIGDWACFTPGSSSASPSCKGTNTMVYGSPGICQFCLAPTALDPTTGTCKACVPPEYFFQTNSTTEPSCDTCPADTPHYVAENRTYTCKACPASAPLYDAGKNTCNACPASAPLYDTTSKTCQPCPSATPRYDHQTQTCVACPSLTIYNPYSNTCETSEEAACIATYGKETPAKTITFLSADLLRLKRNLNGCMAGCVPKVVKDLQTDFDAKNHCCTLLNNGKSCL